MFLSPCNHIISEWNFIMFWCDHSEKEQIRNKASPIIYPSERQAFSGKLFTLKCLPVSALCRLVWTPSIWRCTVKIQSLHWCALWIYTWEFITWLASFALFIEQGAWDCNVNADWSECNVVFRLRAIWQHCLHNALVKTLLWVTGGKDKPQPHYSPRCNCWTQKNVNCCFNSLCISFVSHLQQVKSATWNLSFTPFLVNKNITICKK